jgi:hypothetical protein
MTDRNKFIAATVIDGVLVAALTPYIWMGSGLSLAAAILLVVGWAAYGLAIFWNRSEA